ncbi:MAG: DNA translocase FtsK [Acidobacteriaceae bacterium]|nr:DNA translocase FtsK [Acidobacteriaceae bacterium]
MRPQRLVYAPTRSRRLNEMFGLCVLAAAGLLLLALATYTPSDPSFNTVASISSLRPARNWTGLIGAYSSDLLLQIFGVAIFVLPLSLIRVGVSWMRSKPVGAAAAKLLGMVLWLLFAPAVIALLPGHFLWRHALPIAGVEGRLIADGLVKFVNLPGAVTIAGLMVALSLYLSTTFLLAMAREWFSTKFAFVGAMRSRWSNWRTHRDHAPEAVEAAELNQRQARAAARLKSEPIPEEMQQAKDARQQNSLLAGFLSLFRRKQALAEGDGEDDDRARFGGETPSVWDSLPRTDVDAPTATAFTTAAAAAAPFAAKLAAAAAPLREAELPFSASEPVMEHGESYEPVEDDGWLDAPERATFGRSPLENVDIPEAPPARIPVAEPLRPQLVRPSITPMAPPANRIEEVPAAPRRINPVPEPPAMPSPMANLRDQNIAFGKRADADVRSMTITPKSIRGYKLPPSSLLYHSDEQAEIREDQLREEARLLVEKCAEFGVQGKVEQINPGPVVTTFEFKPDSGVKYAKVTGLADDLCLAMAAESVLIERMQGKNTVGIQVPNTSRETIWLRDVVECESFVHSKSRLAIALGKDINGGIVTADLAAMPHVLIAGSTGSGKSVAINAMIMSVLFKSTPEQVRMILVDPKRVELGMYEGIPHLFTPIITEAKQAANALRNAVKEMERRLKLLAANHVRNIDQFNKLFDNGSEYLFEDVNQEPLPYIMIIIDELADLMMLDRANVEESITRLAQMARAVGIHLVLATQRPSVDVITGLIKANVPTRMSFRLATKTDSRTIIDSNGAESLLGRGDMLYLPPGTSRLQRVHAPFVTEKEIAGVTEFWRAQGEAEYVEGFLEGPKDENSESGGRGSDGEDNDPMFDDAVRLVFEFGKASTSLLQRRLRVGYGRAAHLIDMMERDGLVGPADGSKPREILKRPDFFSEVDSAIR